MKTRLPVALFLLMSTALLAGCAAELVSSDGRSVTVKAGRRNMAEAQDLAEAECLKRGNHARMVGRPSDDRLVFDCVR